MGQDGEKSNNTDAIDQMIGYKTQEYYALELLLESRHIEEGYITIENIDDVCFIGNNRQVLYQIKHHNDNKNHITNSSRDFWKTIYNWLKAMKLGTVSTDDTLKMVIYQRKPYSLDCFEEQMNNIKTVEDALEFYDQLKMWYKQRSKNLKVNHLLKYLDFIFEEDNKDYILYIIQIFELEVLQTVKPLDKLVHQYIPGKIGTDFFEKVVRHINYEFQKLFLDSYKNKRKIIISIKEFNDNIDTYIDRLTSIYKFSKKTLKQEVEEKVLDVRNQELDFVTQLKMMELDDEIILDEKYNYFRSEEDLKRYFQEDLLTNKEFEEYWDNQYQEWRAMRIGYSNSVEDSKKVYSRCVRIKNKLSNETMDVYFHMGNFHKMIEDKYENFYWCKGVKK